MKTIYVKDGPPINELKYIPWFAFYQEELAKEKRKQKLSTAFKTFSFCLFLAILTGV